MSYVAKGSTYQVVCVNLLKVNLVDELEDGDRFMLLCRRSDSLLNAFGRFYHSSFVTEDRHNHQRVDIFYISRQVVNTGLEGCQLSHLIAVNDLTRGESLPSYTNRV